MTASIMKIQAFPAMVLIAAVAVCTAGSGFAEGDCFVDGDESVADQSGARPVELGAVDWGRDFDAAIAEARKTGKPLLVLFQEVPG